MSIYIYKPFLFDAKMSRKPPSGVFFSIICETFDFSEYCVEPGNGSQLDPGIQGKLALPDIQTSTIRSVQFLIRQGYRPQTLGRYNAEIQKWIWIDRFNPPKKYHETFQGRQTINLPGQSRGVAQGWLQRDFACDGLRL